MTINIHFSGFLILKIYEYATNAFSYNFTSACCTICILLSIANIITGIGSDLADTCRSQFLLSRHRDSYKTWWKETKLGMAGVELLPKEYGYVIIVLVIYCFLNSWMGFQVGKARKKYKVYYPTMYAVESENKDAKLFNCVQRGHQNSLEMMPVFFTLMILGGIRHPLISAFMGVLFTVSRYFYFKGYSTGDPNNRLKIGSVLISFIFMFFHCLVIILDCMKIEILWFLN